MKKITTETGYLYIGSARQMLSLYKALDKRELAYPIFSDYPKVNKDKVYGIAVDTIDYSTGEMINPEMCIVSADVILRTLFGNDIDFNIYTQKRGEIQ